MSLSLQFGIPSLDALFGRESPASDEEGSYHYGAYGIRLTGDRQTTSLCFIGPDGTGKSVFGLHLAAQYMADVCLTNTLEGTAFDQTWCPRVLYVSTDLKHQVAKIMWNNFGLGLPNRRDFPFYWGYRVGRPNPDRQVELARLDPAAIESAVLSDSVDHLKAKVHFIDLVSRTMGDDWSFINRLLAVLRTPSGQCAPHLLIIDAVEGFETLVGEKDAFGETTSRRARIAQVMRTAADKCHVCFIVEEPRAEARFPEEFVTDVVVRLRSVTMRNYARRTVEVVKARGQSHVRGQHPFVIRGTEGSTTGEQTNADDPESRNGYVHIYPSLHHLSREEMKARGSATPEPTFSRVAAFGITYLDEMLARITSSIPLGLDDQGLRAQTTTALIGEIATQKTSLATAFLARTFRVFIFELAEVIRELSDIRSQFSKVREALTARVTAAAVIAGRERENNTAPRVESLIGAIRNKNLDELEQQLAALGLRPPYRVQFEGGEVIRFASWLAGAVSDVGAAVLITTGDQDRDRLIRDFDRWLGNSTFRAVQHWPSGSSPLPESYAEPFQNAVQEHLRERTVCRRLELHDLSSAILMQIIQRAIAQAQETVFLSECLPQGVDRLPYHRNVRFRRSWNIRVVIDDLSTLKDTYPDIGADPLFLPFLLSFLEREGVTSLIIDSHIGRPDAVVRDAFDRELRALVPHKLLTWRVPFYGGIRDAITLVPPYPSGLHSVVREVRWESEENAPNALVVDPELELYTGLEKGDPEPVRLEVRLYAETGPMADYIREENDIFGELFTPVGRDGSNSKVIIGVEAGQYNALRDFCNLQTDTLLNHTMVFQVDEFWATDRGPIGEVARFPRGPISRREGALYPLGAYLTEETSLVTKSGKLIPDRIADPFGVFQGPPVVSHEEPGAPPGRRMWQRRHFFARSSHGLSGVLETSEVARIDRVPFSWDFGFLLCPKQMWDVASCRPIGYKNYTVGSVWAAMPNVVDKKEILYMPWRAFLGACKTVAQAQAERTSLPVPVLDVSTLAPESFSCLVLEMWASEIVDLLSPKKQVAFFDSISHIDWSSPGTQGLLDWITNNEYLLALYKTWLLLADTIPISAMIERQTIPHLKCREIDGSAVASRHWYKTACGRQSCPVTGELALPVRLPGHFSIRGDWFLAVAGGSRSERLGRRAVDLLSTRRANFRRMELGIGLPTRDIASPGWFHQLPTALMKQDATGLVTAIPYSDLIGAGTHKPGQFRWLWRSQLRDYHRQSRLLHRWMGQMLAMLEDLRNRLGSRWRSGFEIYDSLEGLNSDAARPLLANLDSWNAFSGMSLLLEEQLRIATNSARVENGPSIL